MNRLDKLIITAALVGGELSRQDTPFLPITPQEIGLAAAAAHKAGAAIAHIHVRDEQGLPSQDKELYAETMLEIKKHCDIIIQVSTGGSVGMSSDERLQPLSLCPEMATLTTGTVNFGSDVFMNSPEQIEMFASEFRRYNVHPEFEIFDMAMIETALQLVNKGYFTGHLHFDFVMGVPGGIAAKPAHLLHMINQLPSGATWSVAGIGRSQLSMTAFGILLGGHVRVGLEDNLYYRKGELASNEQLVARAARIAKEFGRDPATPAEARKILKLLHSQNLKTNFAGPAI